MPDTEYPPGSGDHALHEEIVFHAEEGREPSEEAVSDDDGALPGGRGGGGETAPAEQRRCAKTATRMDSIFTGDKE